MLAWLCSAVHSAVLLTGYWWAGGDCHENDYGTCYDDAAAAAGDGSCPLSSRAAAAEDTST